MLEVRRASADDLDAVRQLLHDTWHATYDATMGSKVVNDITSRWHSVENLTRQLADPDGCFLVAENPNGTIAGHAGAVRKSADAVSLDRLYVLPDLQGSGAGTALLTAVTDWAGQGTTIELKLKLPTHRLSDFITSTVSLMMADRFRVAVTRLPVRPLS